MRFELPTMLCVAVASVLEKNAQAIAFAASETMLAPSTGDADIRDIYALRGLRPRAEIATRLALVIGPAEEVFWRGLVQEALMRRYGRWPGAALAAAAYGGVHVTSGNFTLLGAAATAGAHWCVLYAARVPLGALIVSHVAWDIWIFLVQPTGEVEAIGPSGQVVPFRVAPAA